MANLYAPAGSSTSGSRRSASAGSACRTRWRLSFDTAPLTQAAFAAAALRSSTTDSGGRYRIAANTFADRTRRLNASKLEPQGGRLRTENPCPASAPRRQVEGQPRVRAGRPRVASGVGHPRAWLAARMTLLVGRSVGRFDWSNPRSAETTPWDKDGIGVLRTQSAADQPTGAPPNSEG
jgi:hypothetical protein